MPNGRVLLVEDNEVIQMLASAMMDQWHVNYKIAHDGKDAIEKWIRLKPDLVLMDCQLPVIDGYEATRQIREKEKQTPSEKPTPIIAITANDDETTQKLCEEAGMNDLLSKPFQETELRAVIEKWAG